MASTDWLLETTVAGTAAVLLVLLLRRPLRVAFGVRVAYGAWVLVPGTIIAVLLPLAPEARMAGMVVVLPLLPQTVVHAQETLAAIGSGASGWVLPWAAGALATAAWMATAQRRFVRGLGRLARRADGAWQAERDGAALPATIGCLRPRVIVPADFDRRFDPAQRALVLAHERAHLRRRDPQANAVLALLRCLFWFNPLVHFASACFHQDQELACDACVLGDNPLFRRSYGETLLQAQFAARVSPLGCHFGFGHPLKERIAMLGHPQPSKYRNAAGKSCVLVLALATAFAAWGSQGRQAAEGSIVLRDLPVGKTELQPPRYPAYAAEHHLSGNVVLVVDVAPDGSVANAVIERSEPKGLFDETALQAVSRWKFTPAMKGGKPVASRVRVPIEFRTDSKEISGEEAARMIDEVARGNG
jgi:TonB family protein